MPSTPPAIAWRRSSRGWRAAAVQRLPGADRPRARRAHQAPGRQDRSRAGRRALLGPGHAAPQPDLKWRQTPQAIAELRAKQTAILASAARLVKPGGRLVYATCSLLRARRTGHRPGLRRGAQGCLPPLPVESCWPPRMCRRWRRTGARGACCGSGRSATAPTDSSRLRGKRPDLELKRRHLRRTCQTDPRGFPNRFVGPGTCNHGAVDLDGSQAGSWIFFSRFGMAPCRGCPMV